MKKLFSAHNRAFFILYFVYFCDLFAFSLVILITAPLLLPKTSMLLAATTLPENRTIIIGLLIATYPLAQLLSAPLLGSLSDLYGHKRILLISTLLTAISFVWSAIAIIQNNLHLLFISRLFAGFVAGNIICS